MEGKVSHIEIARCQVALGITIVGGADTPLVGRGAFVGIVLLSEEDNIEWKDYAISDVAIQSFIFSSKVR